ncbi:hypothetical protein FGADI_1634 [Fusarium gaditjirri]|uniref:Uncharacterized protein n=1 Tax=Fusarium gaditjirri TaxID=282569 RepID=A0A8H4X2J4_9HYPO|nr:hypothetical protein FGADI_1634 [Fusarium gaditjirri]
MESRRDTTSLRRIEHRDDGADEVDYVVYREVYKNSPPRRTDLDQKDGRVRDRGEEVQGDSHYSVAHVKVFQKRNAAHALSTTRDRSKPNVLPEKATLAALPAEYTTDLIESTKARVDSSATPVLVALDDEPTGTQTCNNMGVLAHCHLPEEPEAVEEVLGKSDGWVFAPFFRQGGRFTVGDVHYKCKSRFAASSFTSIIPEDLRCGGPAKVEEKLPGGDRGADRVFIVDAVADSDMNVFVAGLLAAEEKGYRFIYRSAAAFKMVGHAISETTRFISAGRDILVMTSRTLNKADEAISLLEISSKVAAALVHIITNIQVRPGYIIVKGGITSSDAPTKGLKMRRALIVGQAAPGMPVWRCNEETSWHQSVPIVVFLGNVGSEITLEEIVEH